jgi:hypothetical protein
MIFEDYLLIPGEHNYANILDPITIDYSIDDNILHIDTVEVKSGYRGKGYFKELLNYFKSHLGVITLECWSTLLPMYKHLGFVNEGIDDQGYHEMVWRSDPEYYNDNCLFKLEDSRGIKRPIMNFIASKCKISLVYYSDENKELRTINLKGVNMIIDDHGISSKKPLLDEDSHWIKRKYLNPDILIQFDKFNIQL